MPETPATKTIPVRIRVVVYPNDRAPGGYAYYVDEYGETGTSGHAVWLTADVPVGPTPIRAEVEA